MDILCRKKTGLTSEKISEDLKSSDNGHLSEYSVTKSEDLKIRNRVGAFKAETGTKFSVFLILVTTYGVRQNSYSANMKQVILMDNLFEKKTDKSMLCFSLRQYATGRVHRPFSRVI